MSVDTHSSDFSLSAPQPLILRLQEILASCSKSIESGDPTQCEQSVYELVEFLNSISDSDLSEPENNCSAVQILHQIHRYLSGPSLDQEVMDIMSFELPKVVVRFTDGSPRCLEIAESIIYRFIEICNPRDMLSILCEALDSTSKMFKAPVYFIPLLSGFAKVLTCIQRRHFEQVKAAVPVILNVLKATSSELDDASTEFEDLFKKAIGIANSMQEVCMKLEGKDSKRSRALLGLFVLQIMALVSVSMGDKVSNCVPLVLQLSRFLGHCELSYIGLITGSEVDSITKTVEDVGDDCVSSFCYVKLGASLAVIWSFISNEVAMAAEVDMAAVKDELHSDCTKRWQAFGMLKHIFSSVNLPWTLKKFAISFLLCIMDRSLFYDCPNENMDYSFYLPGLYTALQAVEVVIMYASDAELRRSAFSAFKKVLADVPTSLRFDLFEALVRSSDSSSMIAILLDCVKEEMNIEVRQRNATGNEVLEADNKGSQSTFWDARVLQLVEFVLRPPKGGPPSLPEYSDAVLSALNLYRFVLIIESTGRSNYTGVLSGKNLKKAHDEWLLPLRMLVTGILTENQKDHDQLACDSVCALNPVEVVLYRCIELVEEKLK